MKKILQVIILTFVCSFSFGQTILEEAYIPVFDSMGAIQGYLLKSNKRNYNDPHYKGKIYLFNEELDTIGYYQGLKRKVVLRKKQPKIKYQEL